MLNPKIKRLWLNKQSEKSKIVKKLKLLRSKVKRRQSIKINKLPKKLKIKQHRRHRKRTKRNDEFLYLKLFINIISNIVLHLKNTQVSIFLHLKIYQLIYSKELCRNYQKMLYLFAIKYLIIIHHLQRKINNPTTNQNPFNHTHISMIIEKYNILIKK